MSWASGRRLVIIGIIAAFVVAALGFVAYSILHKAPSCVDGKLNQDEEGIDCGGSCTYLCTVSLGRPAVMFARELLQGGRTDVIAYVENPNSAAIHGAEYTIELYGADRTVLAEKTGTIDLPPRDYGVVPVYVPGIYSGSEEPAQAFLSFGDSTLAWFTLHSPLIVPIVDSPVLGGTPEAPRVTASVSNPSVDTIRKTKMIATVFDAEGNAIASSQTVLPDLGPGASAQAVFTWKEPFVSPAVRVDVKPVIPVPAP